MLVNEREAARTFALILKSTQPVSVRCFQVYCETNLNPPKPKDGQSLLAIITCLEAPIEWKSIGLYRSLARYASHHGGLEIFAVAPRSGLEPSQAAIAEAKRLGVHYIQSPLNAEFPRYPLANKPISCWHVAENFPADAYLFLDSDTLFLNPTDFGMHDGADVSIRVVDMQGIGISDFSDQNGEYWRELYLRAGVTSSRRIESALGESGLFEYYNSGYVYVSHATLLEHWSKLVTGMLRAGIAPTAGNFFVEQSALSACISASGLAVTALEKDINFPIHLRDRLSESWRVPDTTSIRHLHYHKIFDDIGNRPAVVHSIWPREKAEEVLELLAWH